MVWNTDEDLENDEESDSDDNFAVDDMEEDEKDL